MDEYIGFLSVDIIERIDEWTICFDALNFYVSFAFYKSYDIWFVI